MSKERSGTAASRRFELFRLTHEPLAPAWTSSWRRSDKHFPLVLVCGAKYATSRARWSWRNICRGGHAAMIVDRYDPVNLFELVPKLVADFEPELRELDRLLDDDAILQRIKSDLARRAPHSLTRGRHSTPVEVILRLFVVKRLYTWSYEATEHFVGDSLVL